MAVNIKKDFDKKPRKPDINTLVYGKIPPQAPEMEEAVLGAIMLERDTLSIVVEILPHNEIFYVDAHQTIYAAILELNQSGHSIDLITITEQLRKSGKLEIVGGAWYLTKLTTSVMSSAHVEAHARILYEKYMQRELIRISGSILQDAYDDSSDVFDLLDMAQNELQVVSDVPGARNTIHISTSAAGVMQDIYTNRDTEGHITGVPTGYPSMDEKMYGWQKTDLTILAARPAVGKTAFALNLAFNAVNSTVKKVSVAIFSLEMGDRRITKRGLAFSARVNLGAINRPKSLTENDLMLLEQSVKELSKKNIYLDDTAILTTTTLRNKVRKLMRKKPGEDWLIIIDYLQLMNSTEGKGNREQQVSQISRGLKLLAKELDVPVIALSQLNRTADNDDEPDLKHLRESGAIEQDADNVMFLFQPPKKMIQENSYYANKIMLKGAKFRDGETFLLPLQFEKQFQLFSEPGSPFEFQYDNPKAGITSNYQATKTVPIPTAPPDEDLPF